MPSDFLKFSPHPVERERLDDVQHVGPDGADDPQPVWEQVLEPIC
jgi:hypothetical protein